MSASRRASRLILPCGGHQVMVFRCRSPGHLYSVPTIDTHHLFLLPFLSTPHSLSHTFPIHSLNV